MSEWPADSLRLPNWDTNMAADPIIVQTQKNVRPDGKTQTYCGLQITHRQTNANRTMSLDSLAIQTQNIVRKDGTVQRYCGIKITGAHTNQPFLETYDGLSSSKLSSHF